VVAELPKASTQLKFTLWIDIVTMSPRNYASRFRWVARA